MHIIFPNVLCCVLPTNCIRFTIQEIQERMPTKNNFISARFVLIKPVNLVKLIFIIFCYFNSNWVIFVHSIEHMFRQLSKKYFNILFKNMSEHNYIKYTICMQNFTGFNSLGVECRHSSINGPGSKTVSNTKTSTVQVNNMT